MLGVNWSIVCKRSQKTLQQILERLRSGKRLLARRCLCMEHARLLLAWCRGAPLLACACSVSMMVWLEIAPALRSSVGRST